MNWNKRGVIWILPAAALFCLQWQLHVHAAANSTASASPATRSRDADWPIYGGQPENDHYSQLTQFNLKTVANLHVAWTMDTHK
jgi:glucose dehydrogenase